MPFITDLAGSPSGWPIPGTMAHLAWAHDLISQRINECSGTFGTTYYIGFGTNNAAAGTSPGSPRLCSGVNDIRTFIETTTGNARFLLRNGDRWRLAPNTSGIIVPFDRVTIGTWGSSGVAPPWLDGFKPPYGMAGWSNSTGRGDALTNIWSRSDTDAVYWVRAGSSGTLDAYLQNPYIRFVSGANGQIRLSGINQAPPRSFMYQSGILWVNLAGIPSGELRTLESAVASGCGIDTTNIDKFCVDGLRLTGFGMETDNSQNYQIRCRQIGTKAAVIKNCELYWSSHHVVGHYGGPYTGYSGGITTWVNNRIGLAIHDNAGSAGSTLLVDYNSSGCQESYAFGNLFTHGSLKSYGTNNYTVEDGYGQAMYTHTNGVTKVGFVLWMNTEYESHPTNKLGAPASIAIDAMPAVSHKRAWSEYRGYIINDVCVGPVISVLGGYEPIGVNFIRINNRYVGQYPKNPGASRALSNTPQIGVAINQVYDLDFTATTGNTTGGLVWALYNHTGQGDADFYNCMILIKAPEKDYHCLTNVQANSPNHSSGIEAYNTIFASFGGGLDATAGLVNLRNKSPWSTSGGQSHCAYYRCKTTAYGTYQGFDATLNPVALVTPPTSKRSVDQRLIGRAGSLPSGSYCEFDIYSMKRPAISGAAIGPFEPYRQQGYLPILG